MKLFTRTFLGAALALSLAGTLAQAKTGAGEIEDREICKEIIIEETIDEANPPQSENPKPAPSPRDKPIQRITP